MIRKIFFIIAAFVGSVYCLSDSTDETYYFYAEDKEVSLEVPEDYHIYHLWSSHDYPGSNLFYLLKGNYTKDNFFFVEWGTRTIFHFSAGPGSMCKDCLSLSSDSLESIYFDPADSTYFLDRYIPEINFYLRAFKVTEDKLSETKQILNSLKIHPLKYTSRYKLYDIIDSTGCSTKDLHKNTGPFADPGIKFVTPPRE